MQRPEFKIVICGGGLAGFMTAAALKATLRAPYRILVIEDRAPAEADFLYGNVTAPTAYDFLRGLGLDEPTLFTRTNTSFSFGSHYVNWPGTPRDWLQAHHQPFQLIAGLPLQHHLTRSKQPLEPLLISAQAARQGRFAHPPEDRTHPLSRAEYGYQFDPKAWTRELQRQLNLSGIEQVAAGVDAVQTKDGVITSISLSDGKAIEADLYIDCTGPDRRLIQALNVPFTSTRTIAADQSTLPAPQLGPPCRRVEASVSGWAAQTFLQDGVQTLTVSSPDNSEAASSYVLGRSEQAWHGNCVAIGQAASMQDPLSPAPMIMLQRDIERFLALVPIGSDFAMVSREFNRRFSSDFDNTCMFNDAFFMTSADLESGFWQSGYIAGRSPELDRKCVQFKSRGLLVKYDLEPFNDEDWTILHLGLGHAPARHDRQVDAVSEQDTARQLEAARQAVSKVVPRMPPHHLYVANMKRYFEKQNYA